MAATIFEVHVAIDAAKLRNSFDVTVERSTIIESFIASLDHWIAERRLELRHAD